MKKLLYLVSFILLISCLNVSYSEVIKNINSKEFNELLKSGDGIIIDVRTPHEFHSGHIKEASNIDFYSDEFINKLEVVGKDVPIYIYCRSGGRSLQAAIKMKEIGFNNIYNLIGGINAWNSAKYSMTKSISTKKINNRRYSILDIEDISRNNETVLLGFSTQWCSPCKKMKPVIQNIQEENPRIKIVSIDADSNKELVKKYKIRGIPEFIVLKNNKEMFRHIGIISKEELIKELY